METILLMFSGGIDSACLLHYYLTETDNPVHVHHISIRYPRLMRWKMEDPAVKEILEYCRSNYRGFDYSESRFDMGPLNVVGFDQTLLLMVAGKVAPNLPGDKVTVALGHCYNDIEAPEVQELAKRKTMHKLWMALRDCCIYNRDKVSPKRERVFLDKKWDKEEVIRRTPPELLRLCWSCRRPDFFKGKGIPCGCCSTCEKVESILRNTGEADKYPNLVRPKHMMLNATHLHPPEGHSTQMQPNIPDGQPRP